MRLYLRADFSACGRLEDDVGPVRRKALLRVNVLTPCNQRRFARRQRHVVWVPRREHEESAGLRACKSQI
jgi:hypothetical protein